VDFDQNKVGKKQKGDTNCVLFASVESGISYPAPICIEIIVFRFYQNHLYCRVAS
jgi:hypothetical protein